MGERGGAASAGDLRKVRTLPYIAEVQEWTDSEGKDKYLRDLKRLRDILIHSKKLGYGSHAMGMIYGKLRNSYPKAHEAFEEELRG